MEVYPEHLRARIDELNEKAWAIVSGDPSTAAELAEEARLLSMQHGEYMRGLASSGLTIGVCAWLRGEHAVALEELGAALQLFVDIGDSSGEALARNNIGIVHKELGEFARALEYYSGSLEIHRRNGNRAGEANVLGNIGIAHYSLGEYAQALEQHRVGLEIHRQIGNRSGEASSLNNIGLVFYALADYPQALEHYHAALPVHQENGNRNGEANALNSIGLVHYALGEYPEALEHYRASLSIYREIGNRGGEATALGNIGMVHQQLEEYALSIEPHMAALSIFREIGGRMGEAQSLMSIATTHREMGEIAASLAELDAAMEVARQTGARTLLCDALTGIGRTRALMGEHERALAALTEALALAVELGEKATELELHQLISIQFETMGETALALAHLRRHVELQQQVFSEQTHRTVQNLRSSWQIEVSRKEAEIERLRNVELKQAFDRLELAHAGLESAHADLEQAHDELKLAQLQLVQSEKMASLGQLTAGIAHEINNPINFVSASVGPLRRDLSQIRQAVEDLGSNLPSEQFEQFTRENDLVEIFEELDQLATTIENGAQRTVSIVAGLRSFARLDESGLKRVDIHEGLDATLTILTPGLGEGIRIEREYGRLPEIECYAGDINQVFMNVLTNAIKAVEADGVITIRTEPAGTVVKITIADNGCGMSPEVVSRVFEPFFTTRDVGQGRGLGLSIAWGIIEKHGGEIALSSRPSLGTVCTITLPVVSGTP